MNEYEIEDMAGYYNAHPLLGPATATLLSLMQGVNACSDGWPYWRKPANASGQLQQLIAPAGWRRLDADRPDVTPERLRKAYATLRQFRRHQPTCRFLIHPAPGVPGDELPPPPPQPVALTVKVDGDGQPKFMIDSPDGLQPGRTYQGFVVEVSS